MGRIFEKRKATMFKRYARMAKAFTKLGRELVMAVKTGGPNPDTNPRLRIVMQNCKAVNMPKTNVEGAINGQAKRTRVILMKLFTKVMPRMACRFW